MKANSLGLGLGHLDMESYRSSSTMFSSISLMWSTVLLSAQHGTVHYFPGGRGAKMKASMINQTRISPLNTYSNI